MNSFISRTIFTIIICLVILCKISFSEELSIDFTYPAFEGDFYVSGSITFPPGAVISENNIIVKIADSGKETSTFIKTQNSWPEGSIQTAQIIFSANSNKQNNYIVSFGENITRKNSFTQTAVLPTVPFSVGGAPKTEEQIDLNVGQLNVIVDKSPEIYYYWNILPISFILIVLYLRSKKKRKAVN